MQIILFFISVCSRPSTSNEDRPTSEVSFHAASSISGQSNPLANFEMLHTFLLIWSRLELLKQEWGCRRMQITRINTSKLYQSFTNVFISEVLQAVYKHIASKMGTVEDIDVAAITDSDMWELPYNTTEYEVKSRQMVRLLENIECIMIHECVRKISREHTLVVAERAREDQTLPTDLWKKASMKENFTLPRPHIVEEFIEDLKILGNDDVVTLDRNHLDKCLMKLATSCTVRERKTFLSYGTFYENLLRQQNQLLYIKEREIKHLNDVIESNQASSNVEIDCGLADKSYSLLVEITALRSKVAEYSKIVENQEQIVSDRLRRNYNGLVLDLLSNTFGMKYRFEQFQVALYERVREIVMEVSVK